MRIVFMGTPEFAVPALQACLELGEVIAVITQPDRPRGRGHKLTASPIKEFALARELPVLQPPSLRTPEFQQELAALRPDLILVAAYGRILPAAVLKLPSHGCVNVHASLLPRFRGASPIQRAIAAGDERTGVCLMLMEEGLDTGPVFATHVTPIEPTDTGGSLTAKLAHSGAALLREALPEFLAGNRPALPQPAEGVVLAPPIQKREGVLDFSKTAPELERGVRAFAPWMKCSFASTHGMVQVLACRVGASGDAAPGTVLAAGPDGIVVQCGGRTSLSITELQLAGGRPLTAGDFLRGHPLPLQSSWIVQSSAPP